MSADFPLPAGFHRPMVHAFEPQDGTDECGFCGLPHAEFFGDEADVLPDPAPIPADLLDRLPREDEPWKRRHGKREAS